MTSAMTAPAPDYMNSALAHLARRNFRPAAIADVGASTGSWSIAASPYFPGARFYLFEPLAENLDYLKALRKGDARFQFFETALGAECRDDSLFVTPDRDGSSILTWDGQDAAGRRRIQITTLDSWIESG